MRSTKRQLPDPPPSSDGTPAPKLRTPSPPGLLRRLAAMLYDGLLLFGLAFVATAVWLALRRGEAPGPGNPAYQIYLLALCFAFVGWFWTHGGQTLGMRAWKLRLTDADGGTVSWRQALVRFTAAWISLGLLGLGYWSAWWDPEGRCWHDRLSRTRLTWQRARLAKVG